MASGHEYRIRRPNTWLLRPTCKVKILLANPEPSTHDPSQKSAIGKIFNPNDPNLFQMSSVDSYIAALSYRKLG